MAVFNWSELVDGQVLAFDPALDVLNFDGVIHPADLEVDYFSSSIRFSFLDRTVTVSAAPGSLGTGNLTFEGSGGMFFIGDGTSATTDDGLDNVISGSAGHDQLAGLGGNDYLSGGAGNDVVVGGTGDDTLDGGLGADTLIAGGGFDVFVIDDPNDVIDLSLPVNGAVTGIVAMVEAAIDYSIENLPNIDTIVFYGNAPVTGTGNSKANRLVGNGSNNTLEGLGNDDTLDGGAGNDVLKGGSGGDVMIGGGGDDVFIVDNGGDDVVETSNDAGAMSVIAASIGGIGDTVEAAIDYALGNAIENLTLTGSASVGTGNELDNVLTGNSGGDRLVGLDGNDTLDGGSGDDTMAGGAGSDTYVVNSALDVVTEAAGQGNDIVKSSITVTLDDNVERLLLTGAGDIDGTGNALDNTLTGNTGDNLLRGSSGSDTLIGGGGNDILVWSSLDGSFQGGSGGGDMLKIEGSGRNVDLTAFPNSLISGVERIGLTGSGDNTLTLNVNDVLAMSTTNTVRILGDTGDVVHRGGGWTQGANEVIGANTYRSYTQNGAELLVDTNITSLV